jgi:hypothetical protein
LITGAELVEIRAAEDMTKRRKVLKKGIQRQGSKSKGKKESSDESEADSYITDDREAHLLYCIVVERRL